MDSRSIWDCAFPGVDPKAWTPKDKQKKNSADLPLHHPIREAEHLVLLGAWAHRRGEDGKAHDYARRARRTLEKGNCPIPEHLSVLNQYSQAGYF